MNITIETEPLVLSFEPIIASIIESHIEPHIESHIEPHIESHIEPHIESHIEPHIESHIEPQITRNTSTEPFNLTRINRKIVYSFRYSRTMTHIKALANNVYMELGPGYCESVYQEALIIELRNAGYSVSSEISVPILYKGVALSGHCDRLDIIVNGHIILELKASMNEPSIEHMNQLRRYFNSFTHGKCGAVICFPNKKQIKKTSLIKQNLIGFKTLFYRY